MLVNQSRELSEIFNKVERAKMEWENTLASLNDMIILLSDSRQIIRCNKSLVVFTGKSYQEIIGLNCDKVLNKLQLIPAEFFKRGRELFHKPTADGLV